MPRQPKPGETPGQLSESLRAAAADVGLTRLGRPDRIAYSLKALEASEYAKERGAFWPFHRAVYRAYWEELRDIGQDEVLADVARAAGLEWEPLAEALSKGTYRSQVLQQFLEAMTLGFQGIPAFLMGSVRFTGAQSLDVFRAVATRVGEALANYPESFLQSEGQ